MSTSKQVSLIEIQDRGHKWYINDARAQQVHKFAMEMIVLPSCLTKTYVWFVQLLQVLERRYTVSQVKSNSLKSYYQH